MAKGKIRITNGRCKGCGLCVEACPVGSLAIGDKYNPAGYAYVEQQKPQKCTGCAICAELCPDVAIAVYRRKKGQHA